MGWEWGNSGHTTQDVGCGGLWPDVVEEKGTKMGGKWEKNGRNTHFFTVPLPPFFRRSNIFPTPFPPFPPFFHLAKWFGELVSLVGVRGFPRARGMAPINALPGVCQLQRQLTMPPLHQCRHGKAKKCLRRVGGGFEAPEGGGGGLEKGLKREDLSWHKNLGIFPPLN